MIPGLLFPSALAALGALLIPLFIHFARRTEEKRVVFAALRWLDANPRPRRQRRLDERLLLAVRLLLLGLLALILAQPVAWNAGDRRPVIAVSPTLGRDALPASALAGRRAIWLAPGFAPLSAPVPARSAPVSSLLRELDADLPQGAALEVLVPATLNDADAERPQLSRPIGWRVRPDPVITLAPNAGPPAPLQPPLLLVRHAKSQADQVRWFAAAATAWAERGAAPAFAAEEITSPLRLAAPPAKTIVIWLAAGPVPAELAQWVTRGGTALLALTAIMDAPGAAHTIWQDPEGEPLVSLQPMGAGRVLRLLRPLEPAAMPALLEPDFPEILAGLLRPREPPKRVRASDYAPMQAAGIAPERPGLKLQAWFALAAALMFLLERWLATRPRSASPP